jgi:hypothetical protein
MLRDMDEADPDLEKYVINSVISAMHLDEMDEGDKEDIIAKLEGEEDEEGGDDFDMEVGDEEVDVDLDAEETPEEGGEELSEEEDKETKSNKKTITISKSDMDELHDNSVCMIDNTCVVYPEDKDGFDVLEKVNKLGGGNCIFITKEQMDMLHDKGKCDCGEVTLVYKEGGKEETNEGRVFSKKQLMESFLRRETKKSLKKVLKERRELCEECLGEGCPSCMNEHHMGSKATYDRYPHYDKESYILDEDDLMYEKLVGGQSKLDRNKNGRLDSEDFKMLRKGKKRLGEYDEEFLDFDFDLPKKPRSERPSYRPTTPPRMKPDLSDRLRPRGLDEEMDVMDAIATGQGYLQATGDGDRDYDGVPNRLDLDNNNDGQLDFAMGSGRYGGDRGIADDYIEMDIDFLRNDSPGTKEKERTITTPTTDPGEKDKWKKIRRPKVDPRPKAGPKRGSDMGSPRPSYRRRGMFR